ncbi:hypothetical protein BDQ17DRAFT_1325728 [Cyathus striatus]|nr:hypothetical protein BDQ17DRAFT_1325728 [Cyathus striatus]
MEVDVKFLQQMISQLDLPNAQLTCWVTFLLLFDFQVIHMLVDKHVVPDGLSRRTRDIGTIGGLAPCIKDFAYESQRENLLPTFTSLCFTDKQGYQGQEFSI